MRIFKVERTDQHDYDEYDSFVVVAENETEARSWHPNGFRVEELKPSRSWPLDRLDVTEIGEAKPGLEAGVVLASFNAG